MIDGTAPNNLYCSQPWRNCCQECKWWPFWANEERVLILAGSHTFWLRPKRSSWSAACNQAFYIWLILPRNATPRRGGCYMGYNIVKRCVNFRRNKQNPTSASSKRLWMAAAATPAVCRHQQRICHQVCLWIVPYNHSSWQITRCKPNYHTLRLSAFKQLYVD